MNDYLCTALVVASGDPEAGKAFHEKMKEFGHFVNVTLVQETRSFIIATLTQEEN